MKVKSIVPVRTDRNGGTILGGFIALMAMAALMLAPTVAESGGAGSSGKPSTAVKFESIPDTGLKRVILTPRAAERLGIETGKVSMEKIVLKQMVGGRVVPPQKIEPAPVATGGGFGGFGKVALAPNPKPVPVSTSSGETWVALTLSQGEWDKLRKDTQVRVLPLNTRNESGNGVMAMPTGNQPIKDMKRSMLKVYYKVPGKEHGLTLYHRVRVELQLSGSDEKQLVVPYSSVYYDGTGVAWVYVNLKPLKYERKRIKIERIVGDLAVLSGGPPVGTKVVTVGAALLYGAEVIYKR